jgi:DNA-directed RNA polymerase subunit K/omega
LEEPEEPAPPTDRGPTVPKPHDRSAEVDRKIRSAVERMIEDVQNPYEAVIVAAQEARRLNDIRLKARSIVNQALEQVEELVPEVPFIPRPVEDEEPEVKATNIAIEKLAVGLVKYELEGELLVPESYYPGEIDFPLYPEEDEEETEPKPPETPTEEP